MGAIETRRISADETIPIRWAVLRPGFPRETAVFGGDEDPTTLHLGVFYDGVLSGVASIYLADVPDAPLGGEARQLRGMATIPEVRGLGCGRALLDACVNAARSDGSRWLWCNARTSAEKFYANLGWETFTGEFDIPTVGPHVRMRRLL
jgi:GNAT superfamily N-acetyltransferase